jgi:EpsI family protein
MMLLRALAVAASLLLATAVIGHASHVGAALPRAELSALPMRVDGWSGHTAPPFEREVMEVLGADEYVHRVYRDPNHNPVSLYVGFYGAQSEGDTMHSPMNCLPGSGWQPVGRTERELTVRDAAGTVQRIVVNQLLIESAGQRQVVLYWYQSQGRVVASEYWSKVYTVIDAIRSNRSDGAIIRVISPVIVEPTAAAETAARFAEALFPQLSAVLPS